MALNKNVVAGVAATGVGLGALLSKTASVKGSLESFIGASTGVIAGIKTAVGNILGTKGLAVAGSAAPFAAPVIGAYIGKKVMDGVGVENKFVKYGLGLTSGAVTGAAIVGTSFAPLFLVGGTAYMGYRGVRRIVSGWRRGSKSSLPVAA